MASFALACVGDAPTLLLKTELMNGQTHRATEWLRESEDAYDGSRIGGEIGQPVHCRRAHAYTDAEVGEGHHVIHGVHLVGANGPREQRQANGGSDTAQHQWVDGLARKSIDRQHGRPGAS